MAGAIALVILATSFPLAGLLSQHRQLAAAAAQLNQLQRANRALAEQNRLLHSKTAVQRLARERYQLVAPGQTLYDVLPPGGSSAARTPGARISGDPGNQPLVAPANAPDLAPDPNIAAGTGPGGGAGGPSSGPGGSPATSRGAKPGPTTFWSRVADSLEFWR